jgi:hypothetical protein
MKKTLFLCLTLSALTACGQNSATPDVGDSSASSETVTQNNSAMSGATLLVWDDLMPVGEDALLAEMYSEFYEDMEARMRQEMTLIDAANQDSANVMDFITEGSAQDTMEQIGTFNVVESLNGEKVRLPGYIVPLDFNANSEHDEFLLVPYFGACLHTPPPPPNQIVFVKASPAVKVPNIDEPVWLEGTMATGKFTSDLGNTAYEMSLSKLELYEY